MMAERAESNERAEIVPRIEVTEASGIDAANDAASPAPGELDEANSDGQLLALWLHGKRPHTQRAYAADVERLLATVGKPLQAITLRDLQAFADSLDDLQPNSRKRMLSSVKSLFTFGHKVGYLRFNVAAALRIPSPKNTLAERILSESEIHAMLTLTENPRNRLLLRLLYAAGARVAEICALTWADVQPNGDSGQVTLYGKGGKTRAVRLSPGTWREVQQFRQVVASEDATQTAADAPLFAGRKGGHLATSQVYRIVRAAAKRAGIPGKVSPHWLRHSHASHALERGASVALVRDTLGHSSLAVTSMYTHAKPEESSALHLTV